VYINLKYKMEQRHIERTLDVIKGYGFECALDLAYLKALAITRKDVESILCVILLAWSHNLLTDARAAEEKWLIDDFRLLALFYRKLAHMVYWHQHENGEIGELKDFLRAV